LRDVLSLLLKTVQHVDGFVKLRHVHHSEPAVGRIDPDLVDAGSDLRKWPPVVLWFAALSFRNSYPRDLPCGFRKIPHIIER
jgi:hypothetical protein